MKALIDTCIIIDALQSREPFKECAEKLFLHAANHSFEAFITAKSVTDIYYLTHRITHNDKDTRMILSRLFVIFDPVDTTGMDCKKALLSEIKDYEDAVMLETAKRLEIDCIVTRNVKDYVNSQMPIYQPAEFLDLLEQEITSVEG